MDIDTIEKIDQPKTAEARDIKLREMSRKMEAAFLTYVFKSLEKTISPFHITVRLKKQLRFRRHIINVRGPKKQFIWN